MPGFDLYEAIESCADLLENFGGHLYAAGMTMKEENLPEFCRRIENFISGKIIPQMQTPVVNIDAKICFSHIPLLSLTARLSVITTDSMLC